MYVRKLYNINRNKVIKLTNIQNALLYTQKYVQNLQL